MYIAYRIETYDGIDYMQPVGVFRNKKDMNDFKSISPSNLKLWIFMWCNQFVICKRR